MLPIQGPTVRTHNSAKRLPASDGSYPLWSHEMEEGVSRPTREIETGDLEDAEEVGSASPGLVVQWWPSLIAQHSPRPRRNAPIPARYRD